MKKHSHERSSFLSALVRSPEDAALRMVYADYLDEQGDSREAALQRVIACPDDDGLRLAYADVIDDGSDGGPQADVIRTMVNHPKWFFDGTWASWWCKSRRSAAEFVDANLDLIAFGDLGISTHSAVGSYFWIRNTGVTDDHDNVMLDFQRGFVKSVRTTLGTFRHLAPKLFRHPVESVTLWDLEPWSDITGSLFGWWDVNHVCDEDNSTLPTLLMLCMSDDPRRKDYGISVRFRKDRKGMGGCVLFDSAATALDALKCAAWIYGRRAADCPGIGDPDNVEISRT